MSHRNPILQPKKPHGHTEQGETGLLKQAVVIMIAVAIGQGFVLYEYFAGITLGTHRMWTIGIGIISCLSFLRARMVLGYVETDRVDTTVDICTFSGLILSAGLTIVNIIPDAIYRSNIVASALIIALSWMILISLVLCISIWKTEDKIIDEVTNR